ncbi:MAG TPA: hypothetical protein VFL59_03805, partial [Candidatus Nanopelagicales bacterium]|nr:hypothetical protein [Candidatus Nanopelagicales bacterium]
MTNPTPRPALRKAEDATVHPAAPRPARTPRPATKKAAPAPVVEPAAVPAAAPAAAAEKPRVAAKTGKKKRKFGGATSDHLRPEPAADVPAPASRKVSSPSKPAAAPAGKP